MKILETERLNLRLITLDDAPFILQLLNEPSWLQFIGDKGVRTLEDAQNYILKGPIEMYERLGHGLYLTELKAERLPIGICGLIKRDYLEDADIGFAFLPKYWSKGYAFESATSVLTYGKEVLGLKRIVAITNPNNHSSTKLLEKLGLHFDSMIRLTQNSKELKLFSNDKNLIS